MDFCSAMQTCRTSCSCCSGGPAHQGPVKVTAVRGTGVQQGLCTARTQSWQDPAAISLAATMTAGKRLRVQAPAGCSGIAAGQHLLHHSLHGCRAPSECREGLPWWLSRVQSGLTGLIEGLVCVCCRLPQGQSGAAELPYSISAVGHSLGGASLLIYAVTAARAGRSTGISRLILLTPAGFHHNCPIVSLAAPFLPPEGGSAGKGTLEDCLAWCCRDACGKGRYLLAWSSSPRWSGCTPLACMGLLEAMCHACLSGSETGLTCAAVRLVDIVTDRHT